MNECVIANLQGKKISIKDRVESREHADRRVGNQFSSLRARRRVCPRNARRDDFEAIESYCVAAFKVRNGIKIGYILSIFQTRMTTQWSPG